MNVMSRCSSNCQNSDSRFMLEKILPFSILALMFFCLSIGTFVTLHASSVSFLKWYGLGFFFCKIVVIKLVIVASLEFILEKIIAFLIFVLMYFVNENKDILILGKTAIQGLDDTTLIAEAEYPNGINIFVNATKYINSKQKALK